MSGFSFADGHTECGSSCGVGCWPLLITPQVLHELNLVGGPSQTFVEYIHTLLELQMFTNSSVRPETVAMKHFCQMMIRPHQQSKGRLLKSFTRPSPTGKLIFFGSYICIIVMDRVSKEEEKNYLQFSNFEISCRYLGNSNISRD